MGFRETLARMMDIDGEQARIQQQKEENKLRMQLYKHQIDRLKINDQLSDREAARKEQIQLVDLLQGRQGQMLPGIRMPGTNAPDVTPPDQGSLMNNLIRQKVGVQSAPIPAGLEGRTVAPVEVQNPEMNIPGVFGPDTMIRPQNRTESLRQALQDLQMKKAMEGPKVTSLGGGAGVVVNPDGTISEVGASPSAEKDLDRMQRERLQKEQQEFTTKRDEANRSFQAAQQMKRTAVTENLARGRMKIAEAMINLPPADSTLVSDLAIAQIQLEKMTGRDFETLKGVIGPAVGRIVTPAKEFAGKLTEKQTKALANVQAYGNTLLKLRSGAAVTTQEYERFLKEIQNPKISPEMFKARVENQMEMIKDRLKLKINTMSDERKRMAWQALNSVGLDETMLNQGGEDTSWANPF